MCCSGARFTIENFLLFVVMVNKVFLEREVDYSSTTYSPCFQCDNLLTIIFLVDNSYGHRAIVIITTQLLLS
jgi:hypothetical protein